MAKELVNPRTVDAHVEFETSAPSKKYSLPGFLHFDHNGLPCELDLSLADVAQDFVSALLNPDSESALAGMPVRIRTTEVPNMAATIKLVRNVNLDSSGTVVARCLLVDVRCNEDQGDGQGTWRLNLTNVKLKIGDVKSDIPPASGSPKHLWGWRLDKIAFYVDDREWILEDHLFGQWKKRDDLDFNAPIVSATLTTAALPDDTAAIVCDAADTITALLTLASGKSVRAVKIERLDTNGKSNWWSVRNLLAFPFDRSGFSAIDNWQPKTLKTFVENAYPIVVADREWWLATLDMFMQVHVNPYLETKAMILNVLADRIAAKLGGERKEAEIDIQLNAKLKEKQFQTSLHNLLTGLTVQWTTDRTNNLISAIKRWNAQPSFTEGIRRACDAVRLEPPPTKLLRTRHRLLHVGELKPPDMTLVDYWKELEALVLLLVVRMLDYEGFVYASKFGASQILLKDYLVSASASDGDK